MIGKLFIPQLCYIICYRMDRMNRYYLKRFLSSLVIIAIIVGGVFVSYDFNISQFRFYYFLFYVFGLSIIIPTYILVYWFIKRKRETHKPSKITEVYIDHARDLVTDKEKILAKNYKVHHS